MSSLALYIILYKLSLSSISMQLHNNSEPSGGVHDIAHLTKVVQDGLDGTAHHQNIDYKIS